jgi:hypothetical protein
MDISLVQKPCIRVGRDTGSCGELTRLFTHAYLPSTISGDLLNENPLKIILCRVVVEVLEMAVSWVHSLETTSCELTR